MEGNVLDAISSHEGTPLVSVRYLMVAESLPGNTAHSGVSFA
jgi:hypothetical protein